MKLQKNILFIANFSIKSLLDDVITRAVVMCNTSPRKVFNNFYLISDLI